jgi:DNA processing protein
MSTNNIQLSFAVLHSLGFTQRKLRDISPDQIDEYLQTFDMQKLIEAGFQIDKASSIVDKNTPQYVERVERTLRDLNIYLVHREDPEYPSLLKVLPDAPTILYYRGQLPPNDALISVVGSRKHSQYAVSSLEKIIPDLIRAGYGIISGGAYGIDSVAHEITLKHNGYTAAVFGAGIDVSYPPSNTSLFDQIIANGGAIMSQFPLGTTAEPFNFPIRNAVVAGMSRGTLIAEAGEDSGTLITARLAVEANHDVFVIPADITREWARGSNALVRDGLGKLIMSADDILSEYQIVDKQMSLLSTRPAFDDPIHASLYEMLCMDSLGIDALSEKLQEDMSIVVNALALMEIEGYITSSGGMYRVV